MESQGHCVVTTIEEKLCVIKFSRPQKNNALRIKEYIALRSALNNAASNPDVTVVVLTGEGKYFTAGNDFTDAMKNLINKTDEGVEEIKSSSKTAFRDLITTVINFPKPLVAVVNGPAVGMGVTILALFDAVYASDKATFHAPFVRLGLTPEGCSSYTFPRIMGMGKAAEVLLFGKKLTAEEAYDRGLVTEVIPHQSLDQVWSRVREYAKLPLRSLTTVKEMLRADTRETLHKINSMEMECLQKAVISEEAFTGLMKVFAMKSKL